MSSLRGIFFGADVARAVAVRLREDGYAARVVRERLAGEDDEDDHPWAVLTDAPEALLDLVSDEYDGWLDRDPPRAAADGPVGPDGPAGYREPAPLPIAPKRIKRP